MNTLLSLLAFFCLCGLSTAFFGTAFLRRSPAASTKRDCQWMAWGTAGRCKRLGNTFRAEKKRDQIRAKKGGNNCVGSNTEYVACTELEYVASTFLDAITSQARTGYAIGGKGSGNGHTANRFTPDMAMKPPPFNPCTVPFTDAAGNLRMLGKPCQTRQRRRRSADGNIEVYEEPLRESIRVKRQTPMKHRDMLFLIDESGSVTSTNFKKEVRLAKAVIGNLCGSIVVEKEKTRVGIMGFDLTQHPMLDFDELFKKAEIFSYMDNKVKYTSATQGRTCLNSALEFTRTKMFHTDRGARNDSDGVEQTIVLITDGCANCKDQGDTVTALKDMRIKLENDKISLLVYFIGDLGPCKTLMDEILDGGRCYQVFGALNWAQLDEMSRFIEDQLCTDSWQGVPSCS